MFLSTVLLTDVLVLLIGRVEKRGQRGSVAMFAYDGYEKDIDNGCTCVADGENTRVVSCVLIR